MKSRVILWSIFCSLTLPAIAQATGVPPVGNVPELDAGTAISALAIFGAGAALVIERIRRRSAK
jgi:hypothetical protein